MPLPLIAWAAIAAGSAAASYAGYKLVGDDDDGRAERTTTQQAERESKERAARDQARRSEQRRQAALEKAAERITLELKGLGIHCEEPLDVTRLRRLRDESSAASSFLASDTSWPWGSMASSSLGSDSAIKNFLDQTTMRDPLAGSKKPTSDGDPVTPSSTITSKVHRLAKLTGRNEDALNALTTILTVVEPQLAFGEGADSLDARLHDCQAQIYALTMLEAIDDCLAEEIART